MNELCFGGVRGGQRPPPPGENPTIYIYIYTRVLPSISIDDDRFDGHGVLMTSQRVWPVLMH